jgi:hypothetical protein
VTHASDIGLLNVFVTTLAKEGSAAVDEIPGTRGGGQASSEGSPDPVMIAVVSWCLRYEHTRVLSAMQQSLHIVFVHAVDRASLLQLVLAQERRPFTRGGKEGGATLGDGANGSSIGDPRKGSATVGDGADGGSVGDLRGVW